MARRRRDKSPTNIKLKQPYRTGPSEKTLLELAEQRGLFSQAQEREAALNPTKHTTKLASSSPTPASQPPAPSDTDASLPPVVERIFETLLWTTSLTTLHFTLDVLVQNQYAIAISWPSIVSRAGQAFLVFFLLFYVLHAHASDPTLLPGLPARYQQPLRQGVFCVVSAVAGCYLIHISNTYSYLAVMKQAPPVGCLWIWAVIELELAGAVLSLAVAGGYLWWGGYSIK